MQLFEWPLDDAEACASLQADSELADVAATAGVADAGELLNLRAQNGFSPADYWNKLCFEFRTMICDQDAPEYASVREKAKVAYQAGKFIGLPALCVELAPRVGLDKALIAPFVALLIETGVTVNVRAWCAKGNLNNVKVNVREKELEQRKKDHDRDAS